MKKQNFSVNQKWLIVFLALFPIQNFYGQIGVGTTSPHESSILDINADDKGVLIPNVSLTGTNDVSTISSPKESLLIYNTNTVSGANALSPGYYFFNGTLWERIGSNSSSSSSSLWKNNSGSVSLENLSNGSTIRSDDKNVFISDDGSLGIGRVPNDRLSVNGSITTGTLSHSEGAVYFGNFNHGTKRKYASVENDVGLYTTSGDVHLSAQGQIMGALIVKQNGSVQIRNYVATNFHETNPSTVLTVNSSGLIQKADFPNVTVSEIQTETSDYSALSSDEYILMDATSGALVVTMESTPVTGKRITVKKIDGSINTVTINGNGKNIEGSATRVFSVPYQFNTFIYNGTQWYLVNQ